MLECRWRECGNEQSFHTFMELQRHVYFHAFHTRLKSIGASLSTKNALPICQFESSHRNNLPDLPDQLRCSWHGCDVCLSFFCYLQGILQSIISMWCILFFYQFVHSEADVFEPVLFSVLVCATASGCSGEVSITGIEYTCRQTSTVINNACLNNVCFE